MERQSWNKSWVGFTQNLNSRFASCFVLGCLSGAEESVIQVAKGLSNVEVNTSRRERTPQ